MKIIKLIKEKADDYDMELKQKADSLMQRKLNVTLYGISPTKRGVLGWACALHLSL